MSSTNKTTNYELSQFIGTDKPAWLTDYNGDMGKIDTGIYNAQTTATGADGKADSNATKIGTLSELTTTDKTSCVAAINEVKTDAGTAQNTATTANTTAVTANQNATAAINGLAKFNLNSFSTLNPTASVGTVQTAYTVLNFATDSSSSVFKVYGRIRVNPGSTTGQCVITLGNTSLRPTTAYSIFGGAMVFRRYLDDSSDILPVSINVATNGVLTLDEITLNPTTLSYILVYLPPCLYFNSDFGDTPTPE